LKELQDKKLLEKCNKIYNSILDLKRLDIDNFFCANLLDWFNEVVNKNIAIYQSKKTSMDQEQYKKYRKHVYWIDFGRNIGSEFQDFHFAVVLYEAKYTAIVVPLTSKKEHTPVWIAENKDVIVDLGSVNGFPEEDKECYACTFLIQTVSKKRLSRYGNKSEGYYDIQLTDEQMKKMCDKINEITYNDIKEVDISK